MRAQSLKRLERSSPKTGDPIVGHFEAMDVLLGNLGVSTWAGYRRRLRVRQLPHRSDGFGCPTELTQSIN
jgi:hypothetical protein